MDIKIMIDAVRQLNETWSICSKDVEKEDDASEVYNAMCEIDEAIINLVEKVSLCTKAHSVSIMYGNSELATAHDVIVKRDSLQKS